MSGIGHLGELEVINYLEKKLGHSVYLPLKDKGIDFITVGKNDFYQIQVKTSMYQKNSYFWFDLHNHKLIFSKNTFYIFVCKTLDRRHFMGRSFNCLVIPSLEIKKWIDEKKIATKKGNMDIMNIFVYPNFNNFLWEYKNKGKKIDLTCYWNNFSFLH